MSRFLDNSGEALQRFDASSVLDIIIIAIVIYVGLLLLRRTTAMMMLRGTIILLVGIFFLARVLDLTVLNWLLRNGWPALLITIPVVFQPEIRRALERLGRAGRWSILGQTEYRGVIDTVVETCENLARNRHGAIVVLERETGLADYIDTGIGLDAALSAELLAGVFVPNSPLHDGATIIRGNRIAAASCTLPLSDNTRSAHLGTRHRAGLGISEVTDALAVVVSEETGTISVVANGRMMSPLDGPRLRAVLLSLYVAAARLEGGPLRRRVKV